MPFSKKNEPSTYSKNKNALSIENVISKQGIAHRIEQIDSYLTAAIPGQVKEIKAKLGTCLDNYLPSANKEYYSTWNELIDVLNLTIKALSAKPD